MEWTEEWQEPLGAYLADFGHLAGDARTRTTLYETLKGIIGGGSLRCARIAAASPILARVNDGAQRVRRLLHGKSTKRSPQLDAAHLTEQLRTRGVTQLREAAESDVWLVLDGSELRKPHAETMPHLMNVRALDGTLVSGYCTLTVLGVTPKRRAILYQHLYSSTAPGFMSQSHEIQQALTTVSTALAPLKAQGKVFTWITDAGFDDLAIWRTLWEQDAHVVCRLFHQDRRVRYQTTEGPWQDGTIEQARQHARRVASAETHMVIRKHGQPRAKHQPVTAELWVCPLELSYDANLRRAGRKQQVTRRTWLMEVRLLNSDWDSWLLLTDWPLDPQADEIAAQAVRIFQMYCQRWAVEDCFKFTKNCLGWEQVQVLQFPAIRLLVALAWVAAGFLYELGVTFEWAEVQLLAKLGGWVPHKGRQPGRQILTYGLQRLLNLLLTEALLSQHITEHGALPPRLAALLEGWTPRSEL